MRRLALLVALLAARPAVAQPAPSAAEEEARRRKLIRNLVALASAGKVIETVVQQGHGSPVGLVAPSPDGRLLATAAIDHVVRLWDLRTGRELRALSGHTAWIDAIAWSPDGKHVAALAREAALSKGDRAMLRVWSVDDGLPARMPTGLGPGLALHLAYSPDGKTLAVARGKGVLLLETGQLSQVKTLEVPAQRVAFSPDGRLLALGGPEVVLADPGSGQVKERLGPGGDGAIAWSPDGQVLAAGARAGVTRLFSRSGKPLGELAEKSRLAALVESKDTRVASLAFSRDGARLAVGLAYPGRIQLWSIPGKKLLRALSPPDLRDHPAPVAFVAGDLLAVGGPNPRIYSPAFRELPALAGVPTTGYAIDVRPDGSLIALAQAGGGVALWSLRTGRLERTLSGHPGTLATGVAFSPDGARLVTGGNDDAIRIWDVASGALVRAIEGGGHVRGVAFTPDGKAIVCGRGGGSKGRYAFELPGSTRPGQRAAVLFTELWSADTGRKLRTFSDPEERYEVFALPAPRGDLVAARVSKGIALFSAQSGELVRTIEARTPDAVAWSPDGALLAVAAGGEGFPVLVVEAASGAVKATLQGHVGHVRALAFRPDGARLALGAADGVIREWDARTWQPLETLARHGAWAGQVRYTPDGNTLVSTGGDGLVRFSDAAHGEPLLTLALLGGEEALVAPDAHFMATRRASRFVHFARGRRTYTLESFDLLMNRPDKVLSRLPGFDPQRLPAYRAAWERRLRRLGIQPGDFDTHQPEVTLLTRDVPLQTRARKLALRGVCAREQAAAACSSERDIMPLVGRSHEIRSITC